VAAFEGRIADAPGGGPTLASTGMAVAEALRRLESGEAAVDVLGPRPLDLAAVVAFAALGEEGSYGPPLARRPPERPRLVAAFAEDALAAVAPRSPRPARLALLAGLLQVLDAWDASHDAAQEADDRGEREFSAYWHGIAHRREPDPGNASYWFRRVGRHPLYPALGAAARSLIGPGGPSPIGPNGWDPSAMIDLCTRARSGTDQERLARRLQRLEMAMLLDATATALG
jgi:hypothetical protein